jgi:HSP20 family protein
VINKFNSFKDIIRFFDDVSTLVDDIFNEEIGSYANETYFEPITDLFELRDKIYIIMEIAGVAKEDLSIAVGPTMIIIQGVKRRVELMQQGATYYNLEIPYGHFKKRVFLPSRINAKSVRVSLKDGLLTMEFKKDEKSTRIIEIE